MSEAMNNMKNKATELANKIMDSNCYLIIVYLISIIFIIILSYSVYFKKELNKSSKNLALMKEQVELDKSRDKPTISSLSETDYIQQSGTPDPGPAALIDYQVMGSCHSCCTGPVINGHVSLEALSIVLNMGVRLLDFEIYFKDKKVVVAAGRNNVYMKDTYNELEIGKVLSHVRSAAINSSNNGTDPLILNFRILSKNPNVYHILEKKISEHLGDYLVNRQFGKGGTYKNVLLDTEFKNLKNKVILFVHDTTLNFMDNPRFFEIVNGFSGMGGNLLFYNNYQIKNENKPETYIEETKSKFCITIPNIMDRRNSAWVIHHAYGIQGTLMNFGGGYNSELLEGYKTKFQNSQKAYLLKNKGIQRDRYKITQPSGPKSDPSPVVQKFEFEGNPSVTL